MSIEDRTTAQSDIDMAIELLEKLEQKAKAYALHNETNDAIFTDIADYIHDAVKALASRNQTDI